MLGKHRKEELSPQGIVSFMPTGSLVVALGGCGGLGPEAPLEVVEGVELGRYTGRWYEISRYPDTFERGCERVTADYALRLDGRISVLNTCREGRIEEGARTIQGVAPVVDSNTNAKLTVSFFGPFEGEYRILELGEEYEYAVVAEPARNFLWSISPDRPYGSLFKLRRQILLPAICPKALSFISDAHNLYWITPAFL